MEGLSCLMVNPPLGNVGTPYIKGSFLMVEIAAAYRLRNDIVRRHSEATRSRENLYPFVASFVQFRLTRARKFTFFTYYT